jgi:hypothetical protein
MAAAVSGIADEFSGGLPLSAGFRLRGSIAENHLEAAGAVSKYQAVSGFLLIILPVLVESAQQK